MTERLERARRWIEQVLEVSGVDLVPASADASFRRYFRFETGAGPIDSTTHRSPCPRRRARAPSRVAPICRRSGIEAAP